MRRVWLNLLSALVALAVGTAAFSWWLYRCNSTFTETFYSLYSAKIDAPVRAILLSDLHQAEFGEENQALLGRVKALHPDFILVAGDLITAGEADLDYAVELCARLAEIAPVYYGLGNHENEIVYGEDLSFEFLELRKEQLGENPEDFSPLQQESSFLGRLAQIEGVTVVQNSAAEVEVGGNQLEIGGVNTNLSSFWPYSGQFITRFTQEKKERFKILISHRPELVVEYIPEYDIDLVVAGHTHGGVIRIPKVGGVLSTDGGLFPAYDAGLFANDHNTMIVSRGLGGHGIVPRVFNQPELVVIDLL